MQHNAAEEKSKNFQETIEGRPTVLGNVESITELGVTITNDLEWNTHIINICTRTLGFLRNCFHVPKMRKKQLKRDWCVQSWNIEVQSGSP